MKIGELSKITGCPVTRIRFYEQKGLLPQPKRGLGGHRVYSREAVDRLEFITVCRANGMKLECIKSFIDFENDPSKGTDWLVEHIDEYLQQAQCIREQIDKAEQYLLHLRTHFPKNISSK